MPKNKKYEPAIRTAARASAHHTNTAGIALPAPARIQLKQQIPAQEQSAATLRHEAASAKAFQLQTAPQHPGNRLTDEGVTHLINALAKNAPYLPAA